ncbi:MAG: hypothetical protein KatS3mg103_0775 [Phycisphaerales bacterium]|nr:MAG: hypothetical protein KatS3mg103_0775 [Phycisphaerales bacterium]
MVGPVSSVLGWRPSIWKKAKGLLVSSVAAAAPGSRVTHLGLASWPTSSLPSSGRSTAWSISPAWTACWAWAIQSVCIAASMRSGARSRPLASVPSMWPYSPSSRPSMFWFQASLGALRVSCSLAPL